MTMLSKKMYDSTKMAHSLLENLLSWSRIQNGAIDFKPMEISILEIVNRIAAHSKASAERKNIKIYQSVALDIKVYADPDMTDTILRNLVSNAVKFTYAGGEIHISAAINKGFAEISVKDTGIGIKQEDIDKLLKIDNKFKREGTEGEQGTGLGLLLCNEFVEKNRGKMWIESKADQGTIFSFTLPVVTG